MKTNEPFARVSTGVAGLDDVLHGGLPAGGVYLVEGGSGTGKTTLGMQFLLDGIRNGETVLFVSLAQPVDTLRRIARAHGWSLDAMHVRGLTPKELVQGSNERQDVFLPEDAELADFTDRIEALVGDLQPDRIVFDSLTMLQILATTPGRYRTELVRLIEFLRDRASTSVLTLAIQSTFDPSDAEAVSDGIIRLTETTPWRTGKRFELKVVKLRASDFRGGPQDFDIVTGGLRVYPRVPSHEGERVVARELYESGIEGLDDLCGGGFAAGTSCLITGPSGAGKTALATQYVYAGAARGSRASVFLFEEFRECYLKRCAEVGTDLRPFIEDGLVDVRQVEHPDMSAGAFTAMVREAVGRDAAIVMIDSLTGYLRSLPDGRDVTKHLRDLIRYMKHSEVLSLLTVGQRGLTGWETGIPVDVAETADAIVLLRYFEAEGALHKAVSVLKKRYGAHAADVRELRISSDGLRVSAPGGAFSGLLPGSDSPGDTLRREGRREEP